MAVEEISFGRLREERTLRRSRVVASLQSLVIFLLLVAMSQEYSHNQYMQVWMTQRFGVFSFLLNGTLAAFYAGLMITYYLTGPNKRAARPLAKEKELMPGREASYEASR